MPVSPSKWRTGPSISHKSCGSTTCESESTQCTIMRHHHEQAFRSNDTTATPYQQCRFLKLFLNIVFFGLLVFFGAYEGVPSSEEYPSYPSELAEPDAARSPTWPLRTVGRDALTSGETPVTRLIPLAEGSTRGPTSCWESAECTCCTQSLPPVTNF